MFKEKWKTYAFWILLSVGAGLLSGLLSRGGTELFSQTAVQPPLSPPAWLFPVVWTILYTLMGIASYLVLTSGSPQEEIDSALTAYGIQLAVNFVWPLLFFNLHMYLASFLWLVHLWLLILLTIRLFREISPAAAKLMVPYLLWVTFAGYLNLLIYVLNR